MARLLYGNKVDWLFFFCVTCRNKINKLYSVPLSETQEQTQTWNQQKRNIAEIKKEISITKLHIFGGN